MLCSYQDEKKKKQNKKQQQQKNQNQEHERKECQEGYSINSTASKGTTKTASGMADR